MKKYTLILASVCLGTMFALTGCENEDYLYKDTSKIWLSGDIEQEATDDSVFYSFKVYGKEVTEKDLNVVVNLTGLASPIDRELQLEVVKEETNVPADAYTIGKCILPANAYKVKVPVTVKRNVTSPDITKEIARLTLKVVPTDDLGMGVVENNTFRVVWCDYLIEPSSWSIISYYIGAFSQARFKFIIDFAGYTDFTEFDGDYNKILWLQGYLNKLLDIYNNDPANAGREEGWPYLNDDGQPLRFP